MPLPQALDDVVWSGHASPPSGTSPCEAKCQERIQQCAIWDVWCWAAVLQEIRRCLLGENREQCALAQHYLRDFLRDSSLDCNCPCSSQRVDACYRVLPLENYLEEGDLVAEPVPDDEWNYQGLCDALSRTPLGLLVGKFQLDYNVTQSHYVLISKVSRNNGKTHVTIAEPWKGEDITVRVIPNQPIPLADWGDLRSLYRVARGA